MACMQLLLDDDANKDDACSPIHASSSSRSSAVCFEEGTKALASGLHADNPNTAWVAHKRTQIQTHAHTHTNTHTHIHTHTRMLFGCVSLGDFYFQHHWEESHKRNSGIWDPAKSSDEEGCLHNSWHFAALF